MDQDKPTYNQLSLLFNWYKWRIPMPLARDALKWLESHATKKDASKEIARVHDLYHNRTLDEDTCFDSPIWDGYCFEGGRTNE